MIKDAERCLVYWQQRLAEKPNDAWARCEVERWKSRIEGLETAIVGMKNLAKSLEN